MDDSFNSDFSQKYELESGSFILSEPFLSDPNFMRSVILVCEHNATGSFGLIFNKKSFITINQILEDVTTELPIFIGGPVQQNTLHYIHTVEGVENAVPLKEGFFWGGNFEKIKELIKLGEINASNSRFFVGYTGWGESQLTNELDQNSWIVYNTQQKKILNDEPSGLWRAILYSMGGKYKQFANYPIDPRLN